MPSVAAGNLIIDGWTVLDIASQAPLTGMTVPADVTLALDRMAGTTRVAATEIITWTEQGVTGKYYFYFTPQNAGLYILTLNEVEPLSMQRKGVEFRWDVVSAGAVLVPSFQDAFCSLSDVARRINVNAITSSSLPSDTDAAAFARGRAVQLMAVCAGLGFPRTPSTIEAGSRLEGLLRNANEVGAALDYLMAQSRSTTPFAIGEDRIRFLRDLWVEFVGGPMPGFVTARVGMIEKEIRSNLLSLSTDHILSGDTLAAPTTTAPTDAGIQVGIGDVY